ncbi:MAG: hypothetical protein H6R01_1646 [Burkholderiaceae bacterium]|nr:hypothetical protein [Burkholderiaceae bacterium]
MFTVHLPRLGISVKVAALCALVGGAITVSGCSNKADAPSKPVKNEQASANARPPFDPKWIPAAKGEGNFEICLSDEAKENGITNVTVPKNIVFQSWGPMTGPLRNSGSYDKKILGEPLSSTLGSEKTYAVITANQVVLTDKEPCQITQVRSVISKGFRWNKELVPAEKHQSFAADGIKIVNEKVTDRQWGLDKNGTENPKEKLIGNAISLGLLNGTLLQDASNPVTLTDR